MAPDQITLLYGLPMSIAQKLGHAAFGARDLYALDLRHFKIPPDAFRDISGHFIACLAMDGDEATEEEIKAIAFDLIKGGCAYICCWGPGCARVNDLVDLEDLALHPNGPWKMSTWQNDVHLAEALWFAINSAWPDAVFEATTHAVVGISFKNPDWAGQIAEAFANPDSFSPDLPKP